MATPEIDAKFARDWAQLAAQLYLDDMTTQAAETLLLAHYSGPGRHYHTTRHIVAMLDGFAALAGRFNHPLAAQLAIFFHDVIYDASRSDNEAQSALLMQDILGGAVDGDSLKAAAFMIEATAKHIATGDADADLVLDLDMAILGQPWPVYERYAAGVMQEFLPVYGEDAYRAGRVKMFLEPTIARGDIFLTEAFTPLTGQALANMTREADILTQGLTFGQS